MAGIQKPFLDFTANLTNSMVQSFRHLMHYSIGSRMTSFALQDELTPAIVDAVDLPWAGRTGPGQTPAT
jgi:hypothetical protein